MFNAKKCLAAFFAGIMTFSSVSVFAETGSIIYYDKDGQNQAVTDIPKDAAKININVNKASVNKGENIYVDFLIGNNPGFASYAFKIEYDGNVIQPVTADADKCKVEYSYNSKTNNKAFVTNNIKTDILNKSDNFFNVTGSCTSGSGSLVDTKSSGLLFTVRFKTVGAGTSTISLTAKDNNNIITNSSDIKVPVYVVNSAVTVVDPKAKDKETTTKTTTTTTTTTEATTETTEVTTEATTEVTTVAVEAETESVTDADDVNSNVVEENSTEETTLGEFVLNVPTELTEGVVFKDTDDYPWAKEAINFLASLGVVKGTDWRIFSPAKTTSRGDFLVIVKRFTGIEGDESLGNLTDVQPSDYYAEAIGVAMNLGLTRDINATEFRPKDDITRQEVITVLAKVLEKAEKLQKSDESVLDNFADEDFVSPYAREYMADMIGMGIVSGNEKKKINPVDSITRAEVCVLVKKVYDLIK